MNVPVPEWIISLAKRLKNDGKNLWVWGQPLAASMLGEPVEDWRLMTNGALAPGFPRTDWTEGLPARKTLGNERLTIAAMAWNPLTGKLSDPYGGRADLRRRVLRAVPGGAPPEGDSWFVHLIIRHGFTVDRSVTAGLAGTTVSTPFQDRAALNEALLSERTARVLESLDAIGWIGRVLPELAECRVPQGPLHRHSAFVHSLKTAAAVKPDLVLRLAALLHDVGKGRTFQMGLDRPRFPGHDRVGAEIAGARLTSLGYDEDVIRRVQNLVRWHMFDANPHATVETLERFVRRVGADQAMDLIELRRADILSSEGMPTSDRTVEGLRIFARRVGAIVQAIGET